MQEEGGKHKYKRSIVKCQREEGLVNLCLHMICTVGPLVDPCENILPKKLCVYVYFETKVGNSGEP